MGETLYRGKQNEMTRSIAAAGLMVLAGGCMTQAQNSAAHGAVATAEADRPPLAVPVCPTETRRWTAHVNAMPGSDAQPTLIVSGEALLPERASVKLIPGPTDRMQPPGQRFTLSVQPSNEAAGWQAVRAEITPALPRYREVLIACDGAEVARISPVETAR